ncbi:MAG: exosortase system-associated protein, TIGR04073 family [Nitrospira sp.]
MQARMSWRARIRSIVRYHNESDFDLQGMDRRSKLLNRMGVKMGVLLAVLIVGLVAYTPAQADESPALSDRISGKLIRGMVNLSTGWIEVPRQIYEVGTHEGWVRGLLRGPFDGIGMFFARTAAGAIETATFAVPFPTYKPLLKPAYAWEPEDSSGRIAADSK